jgi:hypothetical protein
MTPVFDPPTGRPDPVALSWINYRSFMDAGCATGQSGASSTFALANTAYLVPVDLADPHTFDTAWWINGAAVAGNVDVAIWTVSGTTATRVAASTAVAQATISALQSTTFPTTTIGPGLYYIGIGCSSTTAAFWRGTFGTQAVNKGLGMYQVSSGHPAPASGTVATIATSNVPVFGLSEVGSPI